MRDREQNTRSTHEAPDEVNRDTTITVPPRIVLFDGECDLCSVWVRFIIDRDPAKRFRFTSLQSRKGQELLQRFQVAPDPGTMVLIENEHHFTRSTAALRIARALRGPWPVLYAFIVVPRFIRDAVYDWVATRRHRLFRGKPTCRLPTPELEERFLN